MKELLIRLQANIPFIFQGFFIVFNICYFYLFENIIHTIIILSRKNKRPQQAPIKPRHIPNIRSLIKTNKKEAPYRPTQNPPSQTSQKYLSPSPSHRYQYRRIILLKLILLLKSTKIMPRKIRLERRALSWISNNNLSYVMVSIANFFWVTGFIYGNEHNMSFVESQLSRYIMQAIITYSICKYMNLQLQFRSALEFSVLFIRSFIFTVHSFVLCWSQVYLPLYIVHTISAFGPIFVCMLNYFIYGKVIVKQQIIGMLVAFCGILLTVNGRSILAFLDPDYTFSSDFKNYKSDDPFVLLVVACILLLFVVFWAYAILITKKNEHHIVEVVYHQAVFGVIGTSFGYMLLPTKVPPEIFAESFIYIGCVLGGGFTIFNIGLSLSQNTGVCSMLTQMTVIIGYGYSVLRYGQQLNAICVVGTILLVTGVFMVIFKKTEPKTPAIQSKASIQEAVELTPKQ